jgi:phospholipid transport system substrate-binding protein
MSHLRPAALLVAAFLVSTAAAAGKSPRAVVEDFHGALLATMKEAQALGPKGRYARLAPPIDEAFHLDAMIQIASGTSWREATAAQRAQLVAAFRNFSISTYANQFDGYSGQSFRTLGERAGPQDTQLVDTELVRVDKAPVDLTYVMKSVHGRWAVVDVLVDKGISQLARQYSEYRRVLRTSGVDGLIRNLNDKAVELIGN